MLAHTTRDSIIPLAVAALMCSFAGCTASSKPKSASVTSGQSGAASTAQSSKKAAPYSPTRGAPTANNNAPYDPFQPEFGTPQRTEGSFANVPTATATMSASHVQAHAQARPAEFVMFGELDAGSSSRAPLPPDGSDNLRPITFASEGGDFDPTISRDGGRIFFASTAHSTAADIYVKNIDGSAITQLTADPAQDIMPAASPDGRRIAFSSNRSGSWDIFLMSADGGQPVQITGDPTAQEMHPSWSPDGRLIAFCRLGEPSRRWEIWVADADRPSVRRFLTFGLFPNWHPTQNTLVFQRSRERGDRYFSIWTIDNANADPTPPTEIASSASAALINPRWSPDGQFVACAVVRSPAEQGRASRIQEADIWIIKADGSARANVTGGRWMNLMPTWGPDNSLFFVSDRSGISTIWNTNPTQTIMAMGSGTSRRVPSAHNVFQAPLSGAHAAPSSPSATTAAQSSHQAANLHMKDAAPAEIGPLPSDAKPAPTPLADAPTQPPAHEDQPPHD